MPNISTKGLGILARNIAIYNSEASYKKLFSLLFNCLFRFSYCMLKSREQAEEVASDTMFRLWEKRMELLQVENLQVYALIIARNLSFNLLRNTSSGRVISMDDVYVEPDDKSIEAVETRTIHQNKVKPETAIDGLPTRCKLVFKLIKEEGFGYKEVAEILNISPGTVDNHLITAMKKLFEARRMKLYNV